MCLPSFGDKGQRLLILAWWGLGKGSWEEKRSMALTGSKTVGSR